MAATAAVVVVVVATVTDGAKDRPATPRRIDAAGGSSASGAPARARGSHIMLRPFPLAVMTLATFLVVFTLMMARLTAGAGQSLRPGAGTVALVQSSGAAAVTTSTSGSGVSGASRVSSVSQAANVEGSAATVPAIVTRSSGASGRPGAGDD
jgi:hypothetical protein